MKYANYAALIGIALLLTFSATAHDFNAAFINMRQALQQQKHQEETRMFLIAVIDTNDKTIGKRCQQDLKDVTGEFLTIAEEVGVENKATKIISGDMFGKAAVEDAITNWLPNQQVTVNDVVVFYYSGHGFRYPGDTSKFPRMWLKTTQDQDVERNNLQMEEDIYNRIKQLGAGVSIVLSDCCNSTVASANANVDNVVVPAHNREHTHTTDNTRSSHALFMPDQPLSILATAASPGELACGKDDGGFFTAFFLDELDYLLSDDYDGSEDPTWETIFKYAKKNAAELARSGACPTTKRNENGRCIQTAKVKIEGGD